MPLPKLPTKPAALLLAKDYPKATPGKAAVRAVPAAAPALDPVEDLISGKAVAAPKTTRAKAKPAAPKLVAAPEARAREQSDNERGAPHPAKHKPVEAAI